jgi:hypothetical protein
MLWIFTGVVELYYVGKFQNLLYYASKLKKKFYYAGNWLLISLSSITLKM